MRTRRAAKVPASSLIALAILTCAALTSGCRDPLLSPEEERSPFDRYDAVRNQHEPQYIEDKFGRRQPNLKGRLTPKD